MTVRTMTDVTNAAGAANAADGQAVQRCGLTLAIVGVGLIGGSVAAALRRAGAVSRVLGVGRRAHTLEQARALGLIDAAVDIEDAAAQADVMVLAVPVGAMADALQRIRPVLRPDTLLTDAGSTKADVAAAAVQALGAQVGQFVPGHPIAGAETSGPQAAHAALFEGRTVVLTPLPQNSDAIRQRTTQLWEVMGARVVVMTPEQHDAVLAAVSHFPHLLSAAYMAQVASADDADLRLTMAGSGFRDVTRLAAGSPEMWRDIFLANRQAVMQELQGFQAMLAQVERVLHQGDGPALEAFLQRSATARRLWGARNP